MTDYNDLILSVKDEDGIEITYKVLFKAKINDEEICVFYKQAPLSFLSSRLIIDDNKDYLLVPISGDETTLLSAINERLHSFFVDNVDVYDRLQNEEDYLNKLINEEACGCNDK